MQGALNNVVVASPTISFDLDAPDATSVTVHGEWDKWTYDFPLEMDEETGMWHGHAMLTPGQYHYTYVVDGPSKEVAAPHKIAGRRANRRVTRRQRVPVYKASFLKAQVASAQCEMQSPA
jgi:1,4-alpha-glucan branching enzyme